MLTPTVRAIAWHRARRRWVALTALVLLCAVGGTVAITALAAARRTSTAVERALDHSNVADISVDVAVADDSTLDEVRALPEVHEVSAYQFVAVRPAASDLVAGIDVVGVLPLDEAAGRTMDVPQIREGRTPAPDRASEIALTPALARRLGVGVGDRLDVEAYGQDQVEAIFSEHSVEPAGAVIAAEVVGIAEPLESIGDRGDDPIGVLMLSHAVWRAHGVDDAREAGGAEIGIFRMLLRARLHGGAEDGPAFLRGVFDIYGDLADTTFSEARPDVFDNVSHATRVEAIAVLLFSVTALLAAALGLGQALAREATLGLDEDETSLRAVGMRRRELVAAAAAPAVAVALIGGTAAVAGAWAGSAWIPGSAARAFDPDGSRFDAAVVLPAALVLTAFLAVRAVGAAWSATRPAAWRMRVPSRPLPMGPRTPSLALGVGMATRARPALTASTLAVVGVVAAVVFSASLGRLSTTPRLHGDDWDLHVLFQTDGDALTRSERPALLADERIEELSQYARFELALGDERVAGVALHQLEGVTGPAVVAGRLPVADDEIALDVGALGRPRPGIDDLVTVAGSKEPSAMTVVGLLTGTGSAEFVVTDGAADRLGAVPGDQGFFLRLAPDADRAEVESDLRERLVEVERPEPHPRVANLASVDEFPYWVAALLALVGGATVGLLLHTGARRHRHDVAVLKALGFTRAQVRRAVGWQAAAMAIVAVLLGVPLGVWSGRFAWSAVSEAMRVVDSPATPAGSILAVTVGVVVVVQLLAAVPAQAASRTDTTATLRTE